MIDAIVSALFSPESIVVIGYTIAGLLSMDGKSKHFAEKIPFLSAFTVAGVFVVVVSLYYQLTVVDVSTGIQNLFDSVTNYFGIGVAVVGFAKKFIDIK